MPKALTRIEYGARKGDENIITVFNPGDEVKGLPNNIMKDLTVAGAVAAEPAASTDKSGTAADKT